MKAFDAARRSVLAGAEALALGGCVRIHKGQAVRTLVLRLPPVSRPAFWETVQRYAAQNRLPCHLIPPRPGTPRDFTFVLRGQGLDIIGRNNAYDPLQPDDYVVGFYSEVMFGAPRAIIGRYADTFRATVLGDNSVHLISDK
jgi:hypothetical protein